MTPVNANQKMVLSAKHSLGQQSDNCVGLGRRLSARYRRALPHTGMTDVTRKYIRGLVSKKKRRFTEDGFDLDLSYVCHNIIAMGFPADRLEGVYRNHIDDVVRFFENYHKDHYKIYNLRRDGSYNHARFQGRVALYPMDDHHPPTLELMLPFCEDVHEWLRSDEENIVAIHCKAGKGRTGVMICAYLLYRGQYTHPCEALEFYGKQRTLDMHGVTIPSQMRYVEYFSHLLKTKSQPRNIKMSLSAIYFETIPCFDKSGTCSPCFAIYCNGKRAYKSGVFEIEYEGGDKKLQHQQKRFFGMVVPESDEFVFEGDVRIDFFHKPSRLKGKDKMFHFWFNTFFVCPGACGSYTIPGSFAQPHGSHTPPHTRLSPTKSSPASISASAGQSNVVIAGQANGGCYAGREPSSSDQNFSTSSGNAAYARRCVSDTRNPPNTMSDRGSSSGSFNLCALNSEMVVPSDHHLLTLKKSELDRASKDTAHKKFYQDFQVHVVLRCVQSSEDDLEQHRCPFWTVGHQPSPSLNQFNHSTGKLVQAPSSGHIHWSSDSEDEGSGSDDGVRDHFSDVPLVSFNPTQNATSSDIRRGSVPDLHTGSAPHLTVNPTSLGLSPRVSRQRKHSSPGPPISFLRSIQQQLNPKRIVD